MSQITNKAQITSKYSLPDSSQHSNNVTTNEAMVINLTTGFTKTRTSGKQYVTPNQEVEQTLTLINLTEHPIANIRILDTIGTGASFKYGSMTINGQSYPLFEADYYELPEDLDADGGYAEIKYKIIVDENATRDITTISNITYDYLERTDINENSNKLTLTLVQNIIKVEKTPSKSAVVSGDTITYTNIISNNGNIDNTDVWFEDVLTEGVEFVDGSVQIDGTAHADYTLDGFSLDDLKSGGQTIVSFDVNVK